MTIYLENITKKYLRDFYINLCLKYLVLIFPVVINSHSYALNDKIKVLIFSGSNNHNWSETTPEIQHILEKSERFTVEIADNPAKLKPGELNDYDVILSNWNTWPEVTGKRWNPDLERAFINFVEKGKGIVVIHAGSSSLQDWPEFHKIVGGTWEKGITGHGPIHTFKVGVKNEHHPISDGLGDFCIRDELWHRTKIQPDANILFTAHSSIEEKGSGESEPVAIITKYGNGRCFYNILGHNKATMRNNAWKTLLLRGTEWAATGMVTIPPQEPWPGNYEMADLQNEFDWERSDTTLALNKNDTIVWKYNFSKFGKPFFHPINIGGKTLTSSRPPDHPWHYGLWFSWKYINGINYWEEDKDTRLSEGVTEVYKTQYQINDNYSVNIKQKLLYHEHNSPPILTEIRNIYVSSPEDDGNYYIDWTSTFAAGNDTVTFERTPIEGQKGGRRWGGYATLGLRFNSVPFSQIFLLNDQGKTGLDIHTSPTRWTDISGTIRTDSSLTLGITVYDHSDNPRSPVPGYVIDNPLDQDYMRFVYTNPAFLYNSGYKLAPNEKFQLKYRIYIHFNKGEINHLNKIYNIYLHEKN